MTKLVGVQSAFVIFIRLFYQPIMKKHIMHTKHSLRLELVSCGAFKRQGFVAINVCSHIDSNVWDNANWIVKHVYNFNQS